MWLLLLEKNEREAPYEIIILWIVSMIWDPLLKLQFGAQMVVHVVDKSFKWSIMVPI